MTLDQLMEQILSVLPQAEFGEDSDGQIVIYTNMEEAPNGNLRYFEPPASDSLLDTIDPSWAD